ncbi:MAG: NADH-quinone oxidoreductase subunit N [Anaerolineales bacterium]|nr:NADH-quinone oxidoreductase subunit N [Anaerolineales bacterium]
MTTPVKLLDFITILPVIFLAAWACLLLLVDLWVKHKRVTAYLAALGLAIGLGLLWYQAAWIGNAGFNHMVVLDGFSVFVNALLLLSGLLGIALAYGYLRRMGIERGEFYPLVLFSLSGMMLMAQAADLIVVFLSLEFLSIPLYVLTAFAYPKAASEEAGLKYFLLGAFAGGFVVYGIALVYGAAATTALDGIIAAVAEGRANLSLLVSGAALILVGLGFKVAIVPFHMWTPDAYQGAPSAVTAFMSSAAKLAGFAALVRIFALAFSSLSDDLIPILWGLSALTMLVGNLLAIPQTNIKRMLAYSSIAHAGYILMAFTAFGNPGVAEVSIAAVLFYLAAYTVTNYGAWGVVILLERAGDLGLEIGGYAGLGRKYPALAACMTIFMLSLIGLPPTLGLVGKFYLFRAVIAADLIPLAVIGVLTSLISAWYYLRVVVNMYMRTGDPEISPEPWALTITGLMAILTVLVSLLPGWLFFLASQARLNLF